MTEFVGAVRVLGLVGVLLGLGVVGVLGVFSNIVIIVINYRKIMISILIVLF